MNVVVYIFCIVFVCIVLQCSVILFCSCSVLFFFLAFPCGVLLLVCLQEDIFVMTCDAVFFFFCQFFRLFNFFCVDFPFPFSQIEAQRCQKQIMIRKVIKGKKITKGRALMGGTQRK